MISNIIFFIRINLEGLLRGSTCRSFLMWDSLRYKWYVTHCWGVCVGWSLCRNVGNKVSLNIWFFCLLTLVWMSIYYWMLLLWVFYLKCFSFAGIYMLGEVFKTMYLSFCFGIKKLDSCIFSLWIYPSSYNNLRT